MKKTVCLEGGIFILYRNLMYLMIVSSLVLMGLSFLPKASASPETALNDYLAKKEPVYSWTLKAKNTFQGVDIYDLRLVSQTWQGIVWTHQLRFMVPQKSAGTDTALLFIAGGANQDGEPKWSPWTGDKLDLLGEIAKASRRPVAELKQVPNQPLFDGKKEDSLISHTFVQYFKTNDETWPLLFPMVKSAIQAMNAIQEFSQKELKFSIQKFVVSGASKRGWTTWLTGASDPRAAAIAPMVIDTLNMGIQMKYQLECWGEYSDEIKDYTEKGIQKKMESPDGEGLLKMVDPYAYRQKLTMPKLIFIGTNDPYWPVDAVKNYFDDLPGETYLHYVPNAAHDLGGGESAVHSLGAFFELCAEGKKNPPLTWTFKANDKQATVEVKSDEQAAKAVLWSATSDTRDFRDDRWTKSDCKEKSGSVFTVNEPYPEKGFKAFYVELLYPSPLEGAYSKCSRVFVLNAQGSVDPKK